MVIEPKVRGFICTTAHPQGCKESVRRQVEATKKAMKNVQGPKKVLVIGASTGYGLASRISVAFGYEAATIGVMFEKEPKEKRTASAGFYNTKAFEEFAKEDGLYAKSFNGDGFSKEMKEQVIETIKKDWGKADMVIYSLAAPRRNMEDGTTYSSVLKTIGGVFENKNVDLKTNEICSASISAATEDEIAATVKVMGGEDWRDWMDALLEADALEDGAATVAYSYIGPKLTFPIYHDGTIGQAKKHLFNTANQMTADYAGKGIQAYVSVNKALVTQSSSAIPVVPLYISILYSVMKEQGVHEGCIEQMNRLFGQKMLPGSVETDGEGYIRLDDWEMEPKVQTEVMKRWEDITTDNAKEISDMNGYWDDFYNMFGFHYDNVDYSEDIDLLA